MNTPATRAFYGDKAMRLCACTVLEAFGPDTAEELVRRAKRNSLAKVFVQAADDYEPDPFLGE